MLSEVSYLGQVGSGKESEAAGFSVILICGDQRKTLIWQNRGMSEGWKMQVVMPRWHGKLRRGGSRCQYLGCGLW